MSSNIKKVVVVGSGCEAWISAFFIKNEFIKAHLQIEVELVEIGSGISEHESYAVLPSYRALHEALGANEDGLLATAKATRFYAQRFSGWSGSDKEFFIAYDQAGENIHGVSFYQCWNKAIKSGMRIPLEEFSPGVVAAKCGKFIGKMGNNKILPPSYGYHLNSKTYVAAVARAALAAGVLHKVGVIKNVDVDSSLIQLIELQDGTTVHGDLFIDASGVDGVLINSLADAEFQEWSDLFPCDRLIVGSTDKFPSIPGFSQITAFAEGWFSLHPLQDRTGVRIHYSSIHANKEDVLRKVSSASGFVLAPSFYEESLTYGAQRKPWLGNCIAVGKAAVAIDDIDATQLQPLLHSLSLLREYFPLAGEYAVEAKMFCEKYMAVVEGIKLFQLSHYLLNGRVGDPLWDRCRMDAQASKIFQHKLNLFRYGGVVSMLEEEVFEEQSWIYLFHGCGIMPERYDPRVDVIPEKVLINRFQSLLKEMANMVASSGALN